MRDRFAPFCKTHSCGLCTKSQCSMRVHILQNCNRHAHAGFALNLKAPHACIFCKTAKEHAHAGFAKTKNNGDTVSIICDQVSPLYFYCRSYQSFRSLKTNRSKPILYASAASFLSGFCVFLMMISTAIRITSPAGSEIHALLVNPAMIYVTNEIAATVIA